MTNPTKKTLRGQFDSLISGISPELRAAHSTRINQNLGDWPLFRSANMVVSFLPMPVEPAITPLLKSCIGARTVALVRTPPDAGTILEVRAWSGNDDELENHPRLPLRQIGPDAPLLMPGTLAGYPEGSCIALVPGLAFSGHGIRLGRGKGWYDRFLAAWPGLVRVGIAFGEQIVETLPEEDWDQRMDWLVTEQGLHACPSRLKP